MAIFTLATTDAGLWAPRFTGTFTTDGTTSVVGVGTEFASSLVGQSFRFVGGSTDYTIAAVTDATHLATTAAIPAGSGQIAFLSSNPQGLIDANFHLLGSAALAGSGDFQPYNAGTTLLGNTTTGSGSIVCNASPTLTTPTIDSLIGNKIYPAADSTAAIQFNKANGTTNVVTIDTTNGRTGVGTAAPNAKLEVLSTTEQGRYSYDQTHYVSVTVNSSGNLTIAPSGGTTTITGAMTIGASGQATITSGGYAQLGWGSASTPAFSFSSAANYGIYYASSAVRISAAGSEVARFSASGCTVSGSVTATQFKLSALNTAPSSSSDTGVLGEIRIVNGYIYICVATNTWQRAALASW